MKLIKLLFAVVLSLLMLLTAQQIYKHKTEATADAHSNIIFTRLAVEAQTYTRQIEYGLKNGKSLENFYGIQNILSEVKRCYSYTSGVYIVTDTYQLLYSSAADDDPTPVRIRNMQGVKQAYAVLHETSNQRYLLSIPIHGKNDVMAGYMILSVRAEAMENTLDDSGRENLIQTMICAGLFFLGGVLGLIHRKNKPRFFFTGTGITMAAAMVGCVLLDGLISVYKLFVRIESIIGQSVSKIVMALQYDLNSVGEKGVAFNKIYDLNTFLQEACGQVPYVDTLIYDKNYQISAVVSESFMWQQTADYAAAMGIAVLVCAAAGLLVVLLGMTADIIKEYFRLRKITHGPKDGERKAKRNGTRTEHPQKA